MKGVKRFISAVLVMALVLSLGGCSEAKAATKKKDKTKKPKEFSARDFKKVCEKLDCDIESWWGYIDDGEYKNGLYPLYREGDCEESLIAETYELHEYYFLATYTRFEDEETAEDIFEDVEDFAEETLDDTYYFGCEDIDISKKGYKITCNGQGCDEGGDFVVYAVYILSEDTIVSAYIIVEDDEISKKYKSMVDDFIDDLCY